MWKYVIVRKKSQYEHVSKSEWLPSRGIGMFKPNPVRILFVLLDERAILLKESR
jgi:hypothetical protein